MEESEDGNDPPVLPPHPSRERPGANKDSCPLTPA